MIEPSDPRIPMAKALAERLKRVEQRNRQRAHKINRAREVWDRIEIEVVDFVQVVIDWNGCCCICQTEINLTLPGTDNEGLTLEHMVSLGQGGSHTARNVGPAHRSCNLAKVAVKDGPGAAKIKRRLGLTGPKARKAKGKTRQMKSRGFDKTITRRMDGTVERRK